jgi:rod shape-determining protein MreC
MKNIILFISQFFNLFLFLVLMIVSLVIMVNYNKTYQAVFFTKANELTGGIGKKYNSIEYYFHLKKTNEQLLAENTILRNQLGSNFDNPDTSKAFLKDTLQADTLKLLRRFYYLPAKVVNNSVNEENNYITLYRGSKQGVKKDMGVLSPNGIVGKVVLVSDNYCRVMSVLSRHYKPSAMLKRGLLSGTISWDGKDPRFVTLEGIPKSVKVKAGDTVLTSTYSGDFPAGSMVGTVEAIGADAASSYHKLKVKTATNFLSVQFAYLVENKLLQEQTALENQTPTNR